MVSNIGPLPACQPVIYYTPFSAGGPMVNNIGLLTVCQPMIYYRPFSAGGPTVGNICPLTALSRIITASILHFKEHTTYCLRLSTATGAYCRLQITLALQYMFFFGLHLC